MADSQAFETFVRASGPTLLRGAMLLTGSQASAEDLVQETLTHLYPRWARVMAADSPVAYVRRAVTNRFVSSRRARASHEMLFSELPDGWDGRDLSDVVATRRAVWQLLGSLPHRQRAAIVLRFYEDMNDQDIADTLDCRPATVRSLISRGMGALRCDAADALAANGTETPR